MSTCPSCQHSATERGGYDACGRQRYHCRPRRRDFTAHSSSALPGYRWPPDVILMAVHWSCRLPLSAAQGVRLLAERDIDVSPRTGLNWVQTFGPQLAAASRRHRRRVGRHWTVTEGFWCRGQQQLYLYRAGDEQGQVIDVLLRDKRGRASAEAVCRQPVARTDITPDTIIPDHHQPYVKAVATVSRAPAMCVRGCVAVAATPPKLASAVTSPPAPGGEGREDAEPFALISSV